MNKIVQSSIKFAFATKSIKHTERMAPVRTISGLNLNESTQIYEEAQHTIPLGEYIFKRINQIGIKSIFGVPGDFNLNLLEHLYSIDNLKWVGCLNELNSAYAADGYARYARNLGVVITTFGVGELSAMNGISGAFAEYVPVLHIVGTSPSTSKQNGHQIHHLVPGHTNLEGPDHYVYEKMVSGISCAAESIKDPHSAGEQVDHLIETILRQSKPGYLFLPSDYADVEINASRLNTELNLNVRNTNKPLIKFLVDTILTKLYQSENPAILGDTLTDRFGLTSVLREFVDKTEISNYASFMGKSILDESHETFITSFNGNESNKGVKESFLSSDLVLHVGSFLNEINTGHYTMDIPPANLILLNNEYIKIGQDLYKDVSFQDILPELLRQIDTTRLNKEKFLQHRSTIKSNLAEISGLQDANTSTHTTEITQLDMISMMQNYLSEDDVFVCETGSFMFGIPDLKFPTNLRFISQGFYLSIGYALPACLGVGMAMKDFDLVPKRLILVEGDGSAQMTIQEFGTYLNQGIKPQIFLLNNNGYTVERIIKGATRCYNDISPNWKWCEIFKVFGDYEDKAECCEIDTVKELNALVHKHDEFDTLRLFEVKLDPMDVPWRFVYMTNRQ